jgi:hypothetical protein
MTNKDLIRIAILGGLSTVEELAKGRLYPGSILEELLHGPKLENTPDKKMVKRLLGDKTQHKRKQQNKRTRERRNDGLRVSRDASGRLGARVGWEHLRGEGQSCGPRVRWWGVPS